MSERRARPDDPRGPRPSRLHFGLFHSGAGPGRWPGWTATGPRSAFGGVGLMVDRPGLAVRVEPANDWAATGPLAERALAFARRFVGTLPTGERRPFRVTVEHAPAEHTGARRRHPGRLGGGEGGSGRNRAPGLARDRVGGRAGRGERSAVGVHGFDRGGLIVEAGKLPGEAVSPLVAHQPFPADWAVLLFAPEAGSAWHGGAEREAFARLYPAPAETEALCRLILTGLLPALASADLDAFGEAVYELNARAGDAFAPAQGGRYAGPAVAALVARLRSLGVKGVGQSSWGPTVFAVVQAAGAEDLARRAGVPAVRAGGSAGAVVNGPAGKSGPRP